MESDSTNCAVKAVLFDLDGVLTDTAEYHFLAWKKLADELGITFSRQDNERLKGVGRLESLDIILALGEVEVTDEKRLTLAERKNSFYLEYIQRMSPSDLLPNARELLLSIREQGIKTALVSASKNAPDVLDRLGIQSLFDIIVDPSTLASGKPAPDIFLAAATALELDPKHCIAIEDAEAGVIGIKAAGMRAISVNLPSSAVKPDLALHSLSQLTLETIQQLSACDAP